jgi:hypothetical protein
LGNKSGSSRCVACFKSAPALQLMFFVANTFQIQTFHKGLAMHADVAFCFIPGA